MKLIFNTLSFAAILLVCGGVGYGIYQNSLALREQKPPEPKRQPLAVEVTQMTQQPIGDRVEGWRVDHLTTDSRAARAGSVFVALVGENFDGNDFIDDAISRGARVVVCSRGRALDRRVETAPASAEAMTVPARAIVTLDDEHPLSGFRQQRRCGQSAETRADDDDVVSVALGFAVEADPRRRRLLRGATRSRDRAGRFGRARGGS